MDVQGACHCGQIRYEAKVDPEQVSLCNCTDCQMLTGSAFRLSISTPRADFHLLRGRPTTYVRVADNGNRRIHAFCPTCGSPVYACDAVDEPPRYTLRVGCLEQRAALPPKRRIWCRSALAWAQDVSGVPGVERQ